MAGVVQTISVIHKLRAAHVMECYKQILEHLDSIQLQQDFDSMANWSRDWNQYFNTSKFIHLSFNTKFPTSYFIIITSSTHRDLGVILSTDFSWKIIITI